MTRPNAGKLFFISWLILFSISMLGQGSITEDFPPPYKITLDAGANIVSWRPPGSVLLFEDFEYDTFPPSEWTASSAGKGWIKSGTEPFLTWSVPDNGSAYALANDDSASVQNDGSMDMLISPAIDLTLVDSCRLIYSSFFNAAYGQAATVDYRLFPLGAWTEIGGPEAGFGWENDTADLSAFSGPGGEETFQLAFHADDMGNHASGWAIDEVEIFGKVLSMNPLDYLLFWDGVKIDSTTGFSYSLPFAYYGEDHQFGICARYQTGNSDTVWLAFESKNLPPPENLEVAYVYNDCLFIGWDNPYHPPFCNPLELQFDFETESVEFDGGSETDGEFVYVCALNFNRIDKYDFEGNLLETFLIPGIPGLCDLAYDPNSGYMYGGHGGTTVYIMDFTEKTKIGQFTAPVAVRGLAYNPWEEAFWASNSSSYITAFEEAGNFLYSFPVGDIGNYYGLAIDYWSDGNILWGFSRDSTGCLLVEYDVETGQRTGRTLDVSPLSENNGMACGLYISYDIYEKCATLGGNLQNDIAFGYALHEFLYNWYPPGVDHFLLYNQDTIIYSGVSQGYFYYLPNYEQNSYKFEVSAWYDLTDFGYPGEFVESEKDGPVYLNGPPVPQPGLEIDFLEKWQSDFTENQWDTTGDGWFVHPNLGNPYPSAVFRGMVNPDNYDGTLTSYWFDVDKGDSCDVMLVLDLKIVDYFPTGLQTMSVEVLDIPGNTWQEARIYHNDTMMLDFLTDSILLSPYVFNNSLRFRFHAYGIDAADVGYWIIDNIRVVYTCLPPYDLMAEVVSEQDSVFVSWQYPYSAKQQWIHRDDSLKFIDAGFDSGPENWYDVAARWDASEIRELYNYNITRLAFIPTMTEASYILKIWSGDSAENLLYQDVAYDLIPGEWYFAEVSPPVSMDIGNDLWIGYSCSSRGGFPFAMDQGPAIDGYGNLVKIDSEWTTMLSVDPELNYNFNIQAQLMKESGHTEAFQVFRSIGSGPFQHIATTDSSFIMLPSASATEEQCFRSRIICYNRPGFIVVSDFSDPDCVLPVALPETELADNAILVFPNPSDGILTIQSSLKVEKVEIYDYQGRHAGSFDAGASQAILSLKSFRPGVYLLKIWNSNTIVTRKIVLIP